ncbi:hypothetical protein CLAIMM_04507 [Cladophialophora immunda]|nr:hypothetical protein CLAIMM_04507 [Cladophialophora immunda]
MLEDLHMAGNQYNVALSLFFVTYIIFEVPSNAVLEKYFAFRPSWWIGGLTMAWGVMMTLHGVVNNYGGLLAVRLVMGALEAGFFPGAVLLLNKWYTKFELSARLAVFYAGAAIAGAFSGLLAYALVKMDGLAGVAGWRWIFIIEGIVTVAVGVLVPFLLADTPEKHCSWLTEDEQRYLTARLVSQDGGQHVHSKGRNFSWAVFWSVIGDWQLYVMAVVAWSESIPGYGLKFTMPQIIKNMGYTSSNAQLMTIPPYFCGAISAYVFGRLSDRFKRRSYFLVIPLVCQIVAYSILAALSTSIKHHIGACFFAVILAAVGSYPLTPGNATWMSNNLAGPSKRAIGLAYLFTLNNCGSVGGSYIYQSSEAPSYPTGFGCSLAFSVAGIGAVIVLDVVYARINKEKERLTEEEVRDMYTDEDLAKMGDRSPLFKYTL